MIKSYTSQFYNKVVKDQRDYLITLDEVKRHLNIDELDDTYDENLSDLIQVGVEFCENYISSDIATTHNKLTVYDFIGDRLRIDEGNLLAFSGITGVTSSMTGIDNRYGTDSYYGTPIIRATGTTTLPDYDVFDNIIDFTIYFNNRLTDIDLSLEYWSGFNLSNLPTEIKQSCLIKIGDLFDVERNSYISPSFRANNVIDILLAYYKKY